MPSINDPENFAGRVNLAALYISKRRETTRAFDSCFENEDGDAVATALYRRAIASPESDLARNIWHYLTRDTVEPVALANAHRTNLAGWARELRAAQRAKWAAFHAEQLAKRQPAPDYREEPTAAGIQLCIPGTERRPVDNGKPAQLSLW